MENEEKARFGQMMTTIFSVYGKDITSDVIEVYWATLKRFGLQPVREAFNAYIQTPGNKHAPRPADIIEFIDGRPEDAAALAWSKVDWAARCVGNYDSVCFDDPIIHAVIRDMGGWIALSSANSENEWLWAGKDFQKRYGAYKRSGGVNEYPAKLIGRLEHHNAREGHEVKPPKLIGNEQRAALVYRGGNQSAALQVTGGKRVAELLYAAPSQKVLT